MRKWKYFTEYAAMEEWARVHKIKNWTYKWTFAYGYQLLYEEGEENK